MGKLNDFVRMCIFVISGIITFIPVVSLYSQNTSQDSITGKVHQIPDVTVSARKTPPSLTATSPFQVMNKSELERMGTYDVAEAVKHFSGVSVKDYGGIGGLKTVSVRSMGAQHTGVTYDGVSVSDCQSGQIDVSRYSLSNVSELSMTIGQTDNIYQSAKAFASAGVLNIQTSRPDSENLSAKIYSNVKIGSFGMINPSVLYMQNFTKRIGISLYGDYLQAEGDYPFKMWNGNHLIDSKRNNSDIRTWRAEANVYASLHKNQELQFKANMFDSRRGLPGSVVYDNPYAAERLYDKNYFVQSRYEKLWSEKLKIQALGKFNYTWTRDYNNEASGITDDRYKQTETYLSATILANPIKNLSVSFAQDFAYNYLYTNLRNSKFPRRYTSLSVIAARYELKRFTASASLLNTYITENVKTGKASDDRKRLSPAFSMSWKPFDNHNLRFRASYKDIFRTPTFNDLYYTLIGNTNLKPETTRQANLGITWSKSIPESHLKFISLSTDAYYNIVNDKIVAVPTMFVWKMMNVGKVETIGTDINVSAECHITENVNLYITGSYNFTQAEDITDETSKTWRNQIIYTPKHYGTSSITLETPWVNIIYNMIASSERYTFAQNLPSYRIDTYTDHGVSIYRKFNFGKHGIKIQFDALNLGGKNYEIIRFYPMPGRNYKISINYYL